MQFFWLEIFFSANTTSKGQFRISTMPNSSFVREASGFRFLYEYFTILHCFFAREIRPLVHRLQLRCNTVEWRLEACTGGGGSSQGHLPFLSQFPCGQMNLRSLICFKYYIWYGSFYLLTLHKHLVPFLPIAPSTLALSVQLRNPHKPSDLLDPSIS